MNVPLPMQQVHFDRLFKPLIRERLEDEMFGSFLGQAYNGWRLGVVVKDMAKVQFIERLCRLMADGYESDFLSLLGELVAAAYDSHARMSAATESANTKRLAKNPEDRFSGLLEKHKTLIESEFRVWATPVYFYACKIPKIATKAATPENYVHVSAGTKYHTIKDIAVAMLDGHLPELLGAIDIRIRNAGGGHDTWEILEDGSIKLYFTNPYSGKRDGERKFTEEEFRSYVKECEKAVWIMKMGLNVFLANNPEVFKKVRSTRKLKATEIKAKVNALLSHRWMRVKEFDYKRESKIAEIVLERVEKTFKAERKSMTFGNGQKFIIIQKEIHSKYKRTILYALHLVVAELEISEVPSIHIRVLDRDKVIADLNFKSVELQKLHGKLTEETIPQPIAGKWPEDTFSRIIEFRVDPAFERQMRKVFEDLPDTEDEWSEGVKRVQSQIAKYLF